MLGLARDTGGGYAERAVVDDEWLFDLPDEASFEEGAAFLMAFLTAWIPLTRQADARPGTRVLVTAAAGGTGGAAVQVARLLGAEVVAACGSEEKLEAARALGAAEAVTYDALPTLRAGGRGLRPRRRRAVPGLARAAPPARRRDRDRVRGWMVAAGRPGAARRSQHRGAGLLSRSPDAIPARRGARRRRPTCCACGVKGCSTRSSARRSRSRRRRRRTA